MTALRATATPTSRCVWMDFVFASRRPLSGDSSFILYWFVRLGDREEYERNIFRSIVTYMTRYTHDDRHACNLCSLPSRRLLCVRRRPDRSRLVRPPSPFTEALTCRSIRQVSPGTLGIDVPCRHLAEHSPRYCAASGVVSAVTFDALATNRPCPEPG